MIGGWRCRVMVVKGWFGLCAESGWRDLHKGLAQATVRLIDPKTDRVLGTLRFRACAVHAAHVSVLIERMGGEVFVEP